MALLPIPLPGLFGSGPNGLLLSHTQAIPGTEVVASSSLGDMTAQPSVTSIGGLGPWVMRSPRVPSTWYIQSLQQAPQNYTVTSALNYEVPLFSSLAGFDVSINVYVDILPTPDVVGTCCYAGLRLDSGYTEIEAGLYRNGLGQYALGVRSGTATPAQTIGDIVYSSQNVTIRMVKSAQFILIELGHTSFVLDTTHLITEPLVMKLVAYSSSNFSYRTDVIVNQIDISPSVLVGNMFADAFVLNDRVAFNMPDIDRGELNVVVSGFTFEDFGTIVSLNRDGRVTPTALHAKQGKLFGDPQVR